MSCGTALEARRNSDERWTFTPSSRNYTFSGMAPLFTVRRGDVVLLQVDQTQTVNGSLFSVVGDSVVLQLKKGDAALLDGPTPDTDAEALFYDVTLTDQTGFENWIVGGPFTLLGLNDVSCGGCNENVEVTIGGQCIQINIEGGNVGIGASVNLNALNKAVQDAETAAGEAEAAADAAAQSAADASTAGATAGAAAGSASGAAAGSAAGATAGADAGEAAAEAVVSMKLDKLSSLSSLPALGSSSEQVSVQYRSLPGDGYAGTFQWVPGNQSSGVSSDPLQGVWVAPSVDPTGASGAWRRVFNGPIVQAEWFGAKSYSVSQLLALNGDPSIDATALLNDAAFDAADAYVSSLDGGVVQLREGIYVKSKCYRRSSLVILRGAGASRFQPLTIADKRWTGTVLLFKGTGLKDTVLPGITSMPSRGGWRPNPDGGDALKLWSGNNANASGVSAATPRLFSVAVLDDTRNGAGGIEALRIAVWRGQDGLSEYSSASAPLWGDDWDFGHLVKNTEEGIYIDFQVVGPWREAGHALMITALEHGGNRAERNYFLRCLFQGRIGLLVRSPDYWKVTASTSDSITIGWDNEFYFNPAGGSFRGDKNYTYTGISHSGVDGTLTFTGVTPTPSSAATINTIAHVSSGMANTEYCGVMSFGLDHPSGNKAEFYGTTSSAMEVSGSHCRGVKFRNSKNHTRETVVANFGLCADATAIDHQFEGGGFVMAIPATTEQSWAATPVRETRNLELIASTGLSDSVDLRLLTPRSGLITELQIAYRGALDGNLRLRPLRNGDSVLIQTFGGSNLFGPEQTTTTAGISFATVSSQTCSFRWFRVGPMVFFSMSLSWTGLDTADTSAISIRLPVNAPATTPIAAIVDERRSPGITLSPSATYSVTMATDSYLGFSKNKALMAYNSGEMSVDGSLVITGSYWADVT